MHTRFVLYNLNDGVYLGSFLGFGIWSLLDSAGQEKAITFDSMEEAHEVVKSWDNPVKDYGVRMVRTKDIAYATKEECIQSDLPEW